MDDKIDLAWWQRETTDVTLHRSDPISRNVVWEAFAEPRDTAHRKHDGHTTALDGTGMRQSFEHPSTDEASDAGQQDCGSIK
jgi:hypothetical protein